MFHTCQQSSVSKICDGRFLFFKFPGTRNLQVRNMLPVKVLENVNDTCLILYTIEAGVCIHELAVRFRRKKHTLFLPMSLQRVRSFLDCCSASLDCFLSLFRSKQSVQVSCILAQACGPSPQIRRHFKEMALCPLRFHFRMRFCAHAVDGMWNLFDFVS